METPEAPETERHGRTAATPPATVAEALRRARTHGRTATIETVAMIHALLDAASLTANGQPSQSSPWLGPLARLLEGLSDGLTGEPSETTEPLLQAVAEALDSEIARWEERARDDGDARAVLRAYLGLRELLWEFGLRRAAPAETPAEARPRPAATPNHRRNRPRARPNAVQG